MPKITKRKQAKKKKKKKNKGGTMIPWKDDHVQMLNRAMKLNKTASKEMFILWAGQDFVYNMKVERGKILMDVTCDDALNVVPDTFEGGSPWPHLVLWCKLGMLEHYLFPTRTATEEQAMKTIEGMDNYEVHHADGYDGIFLKVNPFALKKKDGSAFDWRVVNQTYLDELKERIEIRHKKKDY